MRKKVTPSTLQEIREEGRREKTQIQEATIAALERLADHGNIHVIEPIWKSTLLLSPALSKQWRQYVVAHSFLDYNARGLVGRALGAAEFGALWAKNRSRGMSLDAARQTPWFKFRADKSETTATSPDSVDVDEYARRVIARLQSLIDGGRLRTDGHLAKVAEVRSTFEQRLAELVSSERSRQMSEARLKHAPTTIASAPGMGRRGSPTVSGGLPSLGKRR